MIKLGEEKGVFLFELFIALMILSIGIDSILGIFGQSLNLGKRNAEQQNVKNQIEDILFSWAANPTNATFPESGRVTFFLDDPNRNASYSCEVESENLLFRSAQMEGQSADKNVSNEPGDDITKPSPYYKVELHVTKEDGIKVLDFTTVLTKFKKQNEF